MRTGFILYARIYSCYSFSEVLHFLFETRARHLRIDNGIRDKPRAVNILPVKHTHRTPVDT